MTKENVEVQNLVREKKEAHEKLKEETKIINLNHLQDVAQFYKESMMSKAENAPSGLQERNFRKLANKYSSFDDSLRILMVNDSLPTVGKFRALLDKLLSDNEKDLKDAEAQDNNDEMKRLDNAREELYEFSNFFEQQVKTPEAGTPGFKKWQDERRKQKQEAIIKEEVKESIDNKREQREIREKLEEREKEKQLIQEVAEKGGAAIYMSLPSEYSPIKSGGFTFKPDIRKLSKFNQNEEVRNISMAFSNAYSAGEYKNKNFDEVCGEQKIFEAMAILPITEDVYQEVDVPVQEKKFGIFKKETTRKERKKVAVKPVLHKELVEKGQTEPAYRIIYRANDRVDKQGHSFYRDHTSRLGNTLDVDIILPKSLADKVMEQIKATPKIIRDITKELVLKNIGIPEDAWEKGDKYTHHPLKPPYEEWAKNLGGKSKIYIQENADIEGFNPDWVKEI